MTRKKRDRPLQQPIGEPFVPIVASVLASPAWASLSCVARALYVKLRGSFKYGKEAEPIAWQNGRIFLSVRDAATALNVAPSTAARAFHDLQAKGFVIVTSLGHLGAEGQGKATTFRITSCACREHPRGSREYEQWQPGKDFKVERAPAPKKQQCAIVEHMAERREANDAW
jgi:hypothetical protein